MIKDNLANICSVSARCLGGSAAAGAGPALQAAAGGGRHITIESWRNRGLGKDHSPVLFLETSWQGWD